MEPATSLESGLLSTACTVASLRSILGHIDHADRVVAVLSELERTGVSGSAAASWIRGVVAAISRTLRPDLVWSGPEVPGVYARDTRRVYEELLGSAERSVLASTYAFVDGPKAFKVLAHRMEERPARDVMLLLNIQRKRGDASSSEQVVRRFADRFWTTDWPAKDLRPRVFYDPRSLEVDGPIGIAALNSTCESHRPALLDAIANQRIVRLTRRARLRVDQIAKSF